MKIEIKQSDMNIRNPMARILRSGSFQPQIIQSKKVYSRKNKYNLKDS